MAIIKSTVKVGQKPSKEEWKRIKAEIKEAAKYPINLDDCPELSPDALKEFAFLAAERNRKKKRQPVTIRLEPDYITKYKSLGKGYSGIMADILKQAADDPKLLQSFVGRV
ncbi:hypothetical protein AGMMS50212_00710 [Spirochaetia bacterium]|nr:hypothetical protein AGMMS50212_00710 [Spirochaetia bacterium]